MKVCGKEDGHRRAQDKGEKPIVSMDCKTFGESLQEDDRVTMIAIKDEKTGSMAAHVFQQKGATDAWIIDRICDDLDMFGRAEIILKRDGEPPTMQAQGAVKNKMTHARSARTPPPSTHNPQANGAADRAAQEVMN